MDTRGSGGSKK